MTHHDVPTGANAPACAFEPTGLSLGADASQPPGHPGAWLFKARALDSHRPGPLTLFLPGHFTTLIEQASGMLLHPDDLVGSHTLMVTLTMDPVLGLTVRVIGLDRGITLRTWARDDGAVRASLEADGSWDAQRALPVPRQLRRVILIEPDDGAPHPVGTQLDRWAERGMLVVHRERVAFEEPGAVDCLRQAFERAKDMHDWVAVDAVILTRGSGFAFRFLSDRDIVQMCCSLGVPVLVQRGRLPTLIDDAGWRSFDSGEALNDALAEILRTEVRQANLPRLEAIVEELTRDQAVPAADRQGLLSD